MSCILDAKILFLVSVLFRAVGANRAPFSPAFFSNKNIFLTVTKTFLYMIMCFTASSLCRSHNHMWSVVSSFTLNYCEHKSVSKSIRIYLKGEITSLNSLSNLFKKQDHFSYRFEVYLRSILNIEQSERKVRNRKITTNSILLY